MEVKKLVMKTLYIIGNGFDVAHGLNTSYWGMREYIGERDPEFLSFFEARYNIWPLDDTEPWYTDKAQERWNKSVNHNLWSVFEHHIGNPNTTEMIEMSESVTEGMPKIGIRDHMDYYWKDEFGSIKKIHAYIKDWIETISTDKLKPICKSMISSTDIFLSFNYTDVLEKVYGIDNVLHIHGGVASISDIEPIMGHCNEQDIKKHRRWAKEADDEFAEAEASVQDAVADYLEAIYKDTNKQIYLNYNFFERLKFVNHVVIIGWSGGEVDLPYLKRIVDSLCPSTRWTVYWYNEVAYNALKNAFKKVGNVDLNLVKFEQSDKFWDM